MRAFLPEAQMIYLRQSRFNALSMITPPALKKGSKVGLVAPAKIVSRETVKPAVEILKSWGLKVVKGKNLLARNFQFAGTDAQRTADLQQMLDDDTVEAVFCFRGGYGTTRIIDNLDFSRFLAQPKWIVGYSDITALHLHLHRMGVESLHATMPMLFARDSERSVSGLREILFSGKDDFKISLQGRGGRAGQATGQAIGGNLSLIATCLGTASEADFSGKILFLEDIGEYLYHIDRMMIQLKRAGKLENLAGLVVGHFTAMQDNAAPFGQTAEEIILEAVRGYGYPVGFGFPIGHETENLPIPCGRLLKLKVSRNKAELRNVTDGAA